MRIRLALTLDIKREPKAPPEQRDVDIAGTATERLPEYDEGGDLRIGFQAAPHIGKVVR